MAEFEFDVFLAHRSSDKPLVRELKQRLADVGLKAWLDLDELPPGAEWLPLLEEGLRASKSIAVLIGPDGLGPWEAKEMQAGQLLATMRKRPVIPTLLPGCKKRPELPLFLEIVTWADLSNGFTLDSIEQLKWGITAQKPDQTSGRPQRLPTTPAELWPTSPWWTEEARIPACYRRLSSLCEAGEHPRSDERRQLWQAVKQSRPDSYLAWQLANVARWSAPDYLEVDEQFTPLHVTIKVREKDQPVAEKQQIPAENLEQAMEVAFKQQGAPATMLLAPPGGGKSTLLRHFHLQQARRGEACERIVFYVQLRDYRPDASAVQPALSWLQTQWEKETQNAPLLEAFFRQRKLTLLLDGLNEIPRESQDDYRQRVQEWRDLINEVESQYFGVLLLFSCRPLDYSQRIDAGREMPLPEVDILAMEPDQIHAFIKKKFQDAPAVAGQVWDQLEDHPSFELYSSPYYLNLLLGQIERDALEVVIPDNRAALFSGMVKARLFRECQNNPNSRMHRGEILSERDRNALYSGKTAPLWLPDDTRLFEVLAELAYQIQARAKGSERWGKLPWKKALATAKKFVDSRSLADENLLTACDLGLLEDDAAQAKVLRFIHQLMQEYFAAWALAQRGDADKAATAWRSEDISPSTEKLLALGGDDELPELSTTGWEETTLIAANLIDEPETYIRKVAAHNLPLAGRCAAQAGVEISADLVQELRDRLRERTVQPEADLRARILAGKALGELGDLERLSEHTSSQGTKYLLPHFAEIPAGDYRIGGDSERSSLESSEPLTVSLDRFELALHPATNAEFAAFIKADGYRNDDYWPGMALQWRNGQIGEEAIRQHVKTNIETVIAAVGKNATPEAIKQQFTYLSMASAKWFHERIIASDDELAAFLLRTYPPASGVPFIKPALWRSPQWSNPAQPVVGVCWYEALAYCRWLNELSGQTARYRLPSEAEWEAASRDGGAWRRYAWPGEFDPFKANTAETRLGVTTPVGIFPEGSAPQSRLQDLSGNVWEWTSTPWSEADHWVPTAREHDGEAGGRRVVRGGSWGGVRGLARLGYRDYHDPVDRGSFLGFRVCRASPI